MKRSIKFVICLLLFLPLFVQNFLKYLKNSVYSSVYSNEIRVKKNEKHISDLISVSSWEAVFIAKHKDWKKREIASSTLSTSPKRVYACVHCCHNPHMVMFLHMIRNALKGKI